MPDVFISEKNYTRLQHLARPFIDQPDDVIGRLLDMNGTSSSQSLAATASVMEQGVLQLHADNPDNLTHTKIREASFAGKETTRPNWNKLVRQAHVVARQKLSFEALASVTVAQIREGEFEDEGFTFVKEADMSIQGLPANAAWQAVLGLARHLEVPVRIVLEWRQQPDASHPGAKGVLQWSPKD